MFSFILRRVYEPSIYNGMTTLYIPVQFRTDSVDFSLTYRILET